MGKLDFLGVQRTDPKRPVIADTKTTYRIDARFVRQYLNDSQLSGYPYDVSYLNGIPAHEITSYISAIELSLLPGQGEKVSKCAQHGVKYSACSTLHAKFQIIGPIERTQQQIEEWKRCAIKWALRYRRLLTYTLAEIHEVDVEGTFNGGCRDCELHEWCVGDRSIRQVSHMFTITNWRPWEHALNSDGKRAKPDPRTFYIDNSILKSVMTCSTQALMRYGWGYTNAAQGGPLFAGTAVHRALEVWGKTGSVQKGLAAFDKLYEEQREVA